eukprot:TRINITY_DN2626_c0_g2_i11.p1 TRINITY_DN2626_c0_g2~~TRINITY_DN2626_c0_g2_i11.p1  ORF type:complete len:119 (-),score=6.29 TRINITY_DN2626_c0_g2_i11:757-1113(-)
MFIFSFVFASLVEMVLAQPINSSDSSTEVTGTTTPTITPIVQSCSSNSDCSSTSYCRFSVGTCSGVGECIVIPNSASCDSSISSPLCGCDGKVRPIKIYAFRIKILCPHRLLVHVPHL